MVAFCWCGSHYTFEDHRGLAFHSSSSPWTSIETTHVVAHLLPALGMSYMTATWSKHVRF
jgi:hypothetical protein